MRCTPRPQVIVNISVLGTSCPPLGLNTLTSCSAQDRFTVFDHKLSTLPSRLGLNTLASCSAPRPQDIVNISALFSAHLVQHLASTPWPHALYKTAFQYLASNCLLCHQDSASTPWSYVLHTLPQESFNTLASTMYTLPSRIGLNTVALCPAHLTTRELQHFGFNYVYFAIKTRPQHFGLMVRIPCSQDSASRSTCHHFKTW